LPSASQRTLVQVVDARKFGRTRRPCRHGRTKAEDDSARTDPNDLEDAKAEFIRESGHPEYGQVLFQQGPDWRDVEIPGQPARSR